MAEGNEPAAAPFPFLVDDRYIAVVHADGNGLGQLLMRIKGCIEAHARECFVPVFWDFSEGIEHATRRAVRVGVERVLLPARDTNRDSERMPARPIVLGGDHLTMILRADLALPFTREFLLAFERETAPLMDRLRREPGLADLPSDLTACAGIAYIKASQPFHLAARLAEGITAAVKRQAKANGLEPRTYLTFLFERLPEARTPAALDALLPQNLKPEDLKL